MATRSVLLTIPAFPFRLAHLAPHALLARVAGLLRASGHWTRILDYGTLNQIERFDTPVLRRGLAREGELNPSRPGLRVLWERAQEERICGIAQELRAISSLRFAAYAVADVDEMRIARRVAALVAEESPRLLQFVMGDHVALHGAAVLDGESPFHGALLTSPELAIGAVAEALERDWDWRCVAGLATHTGAPPPAQPAAATLPPACFDPLIYPAVESRRKLRIFQIHLHNSVGISAALDEMRRLTDQCAARGFVVSNHAKDAMPASALANEMLAQGVAYRFALETTLRGLSLPALRQLRAAGCRALATHCPSGSQRLLDEFFYAETSVSHVEATLAAAREQGMTTVLEMRYPAPQDDFHTREETLRLLRRVRPQGVRILPVEYGQCGLWRTQPERYGFLVHQARYGAWASGAAESPPQSAQFEGWRSGEPSEALHTLHALAAAEGIATGVGAWEALAARIALPHFPAAEALQHVADCLEHGDIDALARLAADCNAGGTGPSGLGILRPFMPTLEAVGN